MKRHVGLANYSGEDAEEINAVWREKRHQMSPDLIREMFGLGAWFWSAIYVHIRAEPADRAPGIVYIVKLSHAGKLFVAALRADDENGKLVREFIHDVSLMTEGSGVNTGCRGKIG